MVYRYELKRQIGSTFGWTVVIAGVLLALIYGFYPVFQDSREILEVYLAAFPPEAAAAFGFDLDDLFGFESFSGMVYLYEAVLGSIAATTAALRVFGREKQNKCSDFLLTKPLHRSGIFLKKLLCCLTIIGIMNLPYIALNLMSFREYTESSRITGTMWLCTLCLLLTQLVFLAVGACLAVYLRRIRSASGLGTGIGLFAFLMSAVHSLTEKEIFRFFSPLFYFSPNAVNETGGYDSSCVITAVVLTTVLLAAAYRNYTRMDVAA